MGTTGVFGKIGGSAVKVYIVSFVCVTIASLSVSIFSHIGDSALADAINTLPTNGFEQVSADKKLIDVIVAIVPNNIFSPFLEGSVLSVLFLGILFPVTVSVHFPAAAAQPSSRIFCRFPFRRGAFAWLRLRHQYS